MDRGFEPTTSATTLYLLVQSAGMKRSLFKSHPLHHLDVILGIEGLNKKQKPVEQADFSTMFECNTEVEYLPDSFISNKRAKS